MKFTAITGETVEIHATEVHRVVEVEDHLNVYYGEPRVKAKLALTSDQFWAALGADEPEEEPDDF